MDTNFIKTHHKATSLLLLLAFISCTTYIQFRFINAAEQLYPPVENLSKQKDSLINIKGNTSQHLHHSTESPVLPKYRKENPPQEKPSVYLLLSKGINHLIPACGRLSPSP